MTVSWAESIDGYTFEVVSGSMSLREAGIIVPISLAESLDCEAIGRYVKALVVEARYAAALQMADMVLCYVRDSMSSRNWLPTELIESNRGEIKQMRQFVERSAEIRDALDAIDRRMREEQEREQRKLKRQSHAQQIRAEMQARYSNTFVKLGRRNGFCCAICQSSDPDLQIDHIIPVSKGGTNDLGNLQLLCKDCNRQKQDKIG